jgi:hypothetical protein
MKNKTNKTNKNKKNKTNKKTNKNKSKNKSKNKKLGGSIGSVRTVGSVASTEILSEREDVEGNVFPQGENTSPNEQLQRYKLEREELERRIKISTERDEELRERVKEWNDQMIHVWEARKMNEPNFLELSKHGVHTARDNFNTQNPGYTIHYQSNGSIVIDNHDHTLRIFLHYKENICQFVLEEFKNDTQTNGIARHLLKEGIESAGSCGWINEDTPIFVQNVAPYELSISKKRKFNTEELTDYYKKMGFERVLSETQGGYGVSELKTTAVRLVIRIREIESKRQFTAKKYRATKTT